jgi:hypothetical protein
MGTGRQTGNFYIEPIASGSSYDVPAGPYSSWGDNLPLLLVQNNSDPMVAYTGGTGDVALDVWYTVSG